MLPYFTILLYLHYTFFHCYISSLNKSVFVIVTIQFVLIITILSVWWWWKKKSLLKTFAYQSYVNPSSIMITSLFLIHIYYILCRSKSIPDITIILLWLYFKIFHSNNLIDTGLFFLSYFKNKTCQALLIFTFSLISFLHLIMLLLFSLYQVATNKPLKWAQVITFTFLLNYINYSIIIFVNLDLELSIIWYFNFVLQTRSDATLKMDWISFAMVSLYLYIH